MMAFFASALFKHGKMSMEHILFGSLAGGVSMSTAGALILNPYLALLIGGLSGFISVL